ncbi:MAG: FixH family protein [Kofleriaceae bacterium]
MSASTKWIIAIVGLLAGNIAAMIILATIATATTPGIVPDYYERAAHYDDAIDEAARSRALGWSVGLTLASGTVEASIRDASASPLDGAIVRVTGYPRAHATRRFDLTLVAIGHGRYRAVLPSVGVHDLTVVVERGGERFATQVTVESR